MAEFLAKLKYPSLVALLGFLLILVSYFDVDLKALQFHQHSAIYPTLVLGVILILCSFFVYGIENDAFPLVRLRHTRKINDGYEASMGKTKVRVIFGRIEQVEIPSKHGTVALPANEYFDDDCIADKKSSLGAFMIEKFPGNYRLSKNWSGASLSDARMCSRNCLGLKALCCSKRKVFKHEATELELRCFSMHHCN
jgi:hypothetical protein